MHKRRGRDETMSGLPSWDLGERERKKRARMLGRFFLLLLLLLWRKKGGGGEVVYGDVPDLYSSRVVFEVFAWIPSRP